MPQPLDARIAAAMENDARAATVAKLIAEVVAVTSETQREHDRLDAVSKSATATEAEADQAADDATKLARKAVRLTAKRAQLEDRYDALMNSERRKRAQIEYAAALATRDALVAETKERWHALAEEMAVLLERHAASEAECAQVNRNLYGAEYLHSAESIARNCPPAFNDGGIPIRRLGESKIVSLLGRNAEAFTWPRPQRASAVMEAARQDRIRAAKQREAELAEVKRYHILPPPGEMDRNGRPLFPVIDTYSGGPRRVIAAGVITALNPQQAEAARAKGCVLELAKDGEFIGAPSGVAFF